MDEVEARVAGVVRRLGGLNAPAGEGAIEAAEGDVGPLPREYRAFLRVSDGFEGETPAGNYVRLYPALELAEANRGYEVWEKRPELVLFGSDGGGEGFFFDRSHPGPRVLMIAFVSDWHGDALERGGSFLEFLEWVVGRDLFE